MIKGISRVCPQSVYTEAPKEFKQRETVHRDGAEAARGSRTQLLSGGSGDQRSPGECGSRQVGSTTACAHPASTLSAMRCWESNLPTRQACCSAPALPTWAGILPATTQPRAPCGNTALETALPCASVCAADP